MDTDTLWQVPATDLRLSRDEVHVWRAQLDRPTGHLDRLEHALSTDERDRAGRFRFDRDRRRFVACRGILRSILGRYLGIAPCCVRFCYGTYGKPYLAEACGDGRLCFNLAHSGDWALYVFTTGREVGIDLEQDGSQVDHESIAAQFFSPMERAELRRLPPESRRQGFFRCWTRREAYAKARGEGLSLSPDRFDAFLTAGKLVDLLAAKRDDMTQPGWSLQALDPGSGYFAAVAVEGQGWALRCWNWSGRGSDSDWREHPACRVGEFG